MRDRRSFVDVVVEDIDADFAITFVEGGGAPMEEAVQQQNLLGLLEPYTALWGAVQQGGAPGFMARQYMKTIAEKFDLPRDLHPDELDAKLAEEAEESENVPSEDDQQLQSAVEPEPQEASVSLQDLVGLPPDQAIVAMREIFADDQEMQQVLNQLETLPPDEQAQVVAQMLSGEQGAAV